LPPRSGAARPSAATPIVWETDVDRAARRARLEKRPLLVAACASWAAACGAQEEALRDDAVARAASPFVALRIDLTEDTPEANALASRFHVVGVPSIVLVATDGREEHLDRAATSSAEAIAERLGAFVSR
jgi:thiol:disulfide interchange protein DsbD